MKRANPALRVVLTGCSVREAERAGLQRRYPAVDLFLRPDEEPELVERLGLAGAQAPIGLSPRTAATTIVHSRAASSADHLADGRAAAVGADFIRRDSPTHAWLPIIYGCDKTCTYCIVPFSRGPERSRPFDEIVAEARTLAAQGYREVTLLGQNVNSYGHDLPAEARFAHIETERWGGRRLDLRARPDLAELLRAIDGLRTADGRPAIPRLRFVTSHPWDLSDRLIEAMRDCPSVCEHLHLPIQSGDDLVLRRMGRQYTVEHYLERLARIREAVPGIALSTDVIVGFPGETETQFEATLRVLEHVRYETVFAAAFSPRPGTPAERLADDVPPADKRRRLNALLALQEGIGLERNRAWLGRTTEVLVESVTPPRSHDHDHEADHASEAASDPLAVGVVPLAGRNREHRLVHTTGPGRPRRAVRRRSHRPRRRVLAAGRARLTAAGYPPLVVIAGATATGKTGLSLRLADHLPRAEIISADSRQVYRYLDIGTAKVPPAARHGIPHHGIDLVDPDAPFSVADFARHANAALSGIAGARWHRDPCRWHGAVPAGRRTRPRARSGAIGPGAAREHRARVRGGGPGPARRSTAAARAAPREHRRSAQRATRHKGPRNRRAAGRPAAARGARLSRAVGLAWCARRSADAPRLDRANAPVTSSTRG